MSGLTKWILSTLAVVMSILLLVVYFTSFINPQELNGLSVVWHAFPYIWIINALLLILRIFIRNALTFIVQLASLIVTAPGIHSLCSFIETQDNQRPDIEVLTYNIRQFKGVDKSSSITAEELAKFIRNQNADIVCLQEVPTGIYLQTKGKTATTDIAKEFNYKYACTLDKYKVNSLVILSQYPLHNVSIKPKSLQRRVLMAEVEVNGKILNIITCHLQSNSLTDNEINAVSNIYSNNDTREKEVKSTYDKLKNAANLRAEQVDELSDFVGKLKHRTIVCGDFNDIPISYTYHTMRHHLEDAFIGSGSGIGNTYNGHLPPIRIDYIFHSDNVKVEKYEELDAEMSDHYPIKASIKLLN